MTIKGQRTAAGEETRKEILKAALMLLGRGGPDAFSAGALAREVDVSKATIFHHFASVDEVLLVACDWHQSLELEGHQPTSARAYLDGLGQQLLCAAQGDPVLLKAQAVFVTSSLLKNLNIRRFLSLQLCLGGCLNLFRRWFRPSVGSRAQAVTSFGIRTRL
jgi:AcrR family transcriptional regulator